MWRKFSKEIFSSKFGEIFFQRNENNISTEYSLSNCIFFSFLGEILHQKERNAVVVLVGETEKEGDESKFVRQAPPTKKKKKKKKRKTRSYIYVYTIHFKQRASGGAVLGSTVFPLFAVSWSA
jgi:hypothetical protein